MRYLVSILLGSFFIFLLSCSKEKNVTYAELILGKWDIVNQILKDNSSGESDTLTYGAASTIDFSSNGAMVIKIDNDENGIIESDETETGTYLLENSNLTLDDSLKFTIKTLTTSELSFHGDNEEVEVTINLKR
jgi:hypothetical protein